jgi:hypothetical protein
MNTARLLSVTLVCVAATACADSKTSSADSARAADTTQGTASQVDMIRIDSMAAVPRPPDSVNLPARSPSTRSQPRENASSPPPATRDPMPPLAGETNNRSGTMKQGEPVLRDSVSGPKFRIDSTGKVTRIKR